MIPTSPLGREIAYPQAYDASLLFPIARAQGRAVIGISAALPFVGHDRWHAYELSWLDLKGKPCVATATLRVPADSLFLIESKSLKLYLNSFNAHRLESAERFRTLVMQDLSTAAGTAVDVQFGLPSPNEIEDTHLIDTLDIAIDDYGPPNAEYLRGDPIAPTHEILCSNLLKSNCPVTGQPDWASVRIAYLGARINRAGLLRYLVSFRDHADFHEQCVERIFIDLQQQCQLQSLCVEARYTRRGGLDINPIRATPDWHIQPAARDLRQ